jgi:predicted O-linked N-acetylglucosamine transferase (SPINDLY family)
LADNNYVEKYQTKQKIDYLNSLTLKNGYLHLQKPAAPLPPTIILANQQLVAGNIKQASQTLLQKENFESIEKLLLKNPERTDIYLALALICRQIHLFDKAKTWLEKILQHKPHPLIYNELARIYLLSGNSTKAVQYQKIAIKQAPHIAELWADLARILITAGQTNQAIELFKKAIELAPDNTIIHSNLLLYLHCDPNLDPKNIFAEHKAWAKIHTKNIKAATEFNNDRSPSRPLRIGYISPDFRVHPVAFFFEPLLSAHDKTNFKFFGYSNVAYPDHITERIKQKFDHFRNIRGLTDDAVFELIQNDSLDILVELAGHTSDSPLLVMARKPAPIQVTYLGSPDTTGLKTIDYRFTDLEADPETSQQFYTEKLVHLPKGFLSYLPRDDAPEISALPALRNKFITFASFNNISKVNSRTFELWAKVMHAVPNSKLLLKFPITCDAGIRDNFFRQFEALKIPPDRLAIYGWRPIDQHLKLYSQVDIILDTFPWNGYTTTCEALWMGVPVITLSGSSHHSRAGRSILNSLELDIFAASNESEYIKKASTLASNLESLAAIRASMRQRFAQSPLGDPKQLARSIETAYRNMWLRWLDSNAN